MNTVLPVAQLVWPSIVVAVCGLLAIVVKAYARHRLVKVSLKNVKQNKRAEVIKATALLLDERRWWRRTKNRGGDRA